MKKRRGSNLTFEEGEAMKRICIRGLRIFFMTVAALTFVTGANCQEMAKVKFAIASKVLTPVIANTWVGEYLGYFKEEGIDPTFITSEGGVQNITTLVRNQIQIGMGLQDPLLAAAAKGEDIPIVMVYCYTRGMHYQLGVKPESKIQTIKDLKGKKIGTLSFGSSLYTNFIPAVLRGGGLDPKEVEIVTVGQDYPAAKALYDGRVDALALWRGNYIQMEGMGFPIRLVPQPPSIEKMKAGHSLGVTREYLKNNRKVLTGFLRAFSKGNVFYIENPEASLKVHWRMFPETKPKGQGEEEALKINIPMLQERAPYFAKDVGDGLNQFGQFGKEAWEAYADYLGLKGKVDPSKYYTNELISEANNFDVDKIRMQAKTFDIAKFKSPLEKYRR